MNAPCAREIVTTPNSRNSRPTNPCKKMTGINTAASVMEVETTTKKISFVINVLIENAILYVHEGGSINIESELKNGKLILKIEDNGIGLSKKDRGHLFKRFYRGERAKKMNTDDETVSTQSAPPETTEPPEGLEVETVSPESPTEL